MIKFLIAIHCLFFVLSSHAILIIAHRGSSGHCPENTLSSFAQAIKENVDMIELDVHKCASGELVVFHDARVDRLTNGHGTIASMPWDELKMLTVLGRERIPLLKEVIDFIDRRTKIFIELKSSVAVQDIIEIIHDYVQHRQWSYNDFIIASFDHMKISDIKRTDPCITIVPLLYGIPINFGACLDSINAIGIGIDIDFITQDFVDNIHRRDMTVYVYTVNEIDDLLSIREYEVDAIITDYPCRIRTYFL